MIKYLPLLISHEMWGKGRKRRGEKGKRRKKVEGERKTFILGFRSQEHHKLHTSGVTNIVESI
jgi:ribosomal protein L32E